jgi:putative transposase
MIARLGRGGRSSGGDPNAHGVFSQFRSNKFVKQLKKDGLRGSMGRVGACGDNAAMEPFNSLLQKNVFNQQRWSTRDELRLAVARWIESSYNRRRRQRELGKLTPVEFETVCSVANAA